MRSTRQEADVPSRPGRGCAGRIGDSGALGASVCHAEWLILGAFQRGIGPPAIPSRLGWVTEATDARAWEGPAPPSRRCSRDRMAVLSRFSGAAVSHFRLSSYRVGASREDRRDFHSPGRRQRARLHLPARFDPTSCRGAPPAAVRGVRPPRAADRHLERRPKIHHRYETSPALRGQRRGGRRGPRLLPARRGVAARCPASGVDQRHQRQHPAGRLDHHTAVRQECLAERPFPHDQSQGQRGGAGDQARGSLRQGADTRLLSQHHLFRARCLRHRSRRPHLLRRKRRGTRFWRD